MAQDEEGLSWKDCETNKHKRHTLRIQDGRGKGDPFLLPQWKIRKNCHSAWERIKNHSFFSPGHQDKDSQTQAIDGWVAKEGMVLDIQQDLCIESQCHQDHLPNEAYDQNGQPLGDVQANILIVHALGGIASISRFLRGWFFGSLILQSPFSGVFGQCYRYEGISLQGQVSENIAARVWNHHLGSHVQFWTGKSWRTLAHEIAASDPENVADTTSKTNLTTWQRQKNSMTRDEKGHLVFGIYWQTKKCIYSQNSQFNSSHFPALSKSTEFKWFSTHKSKQIQGCERESSTSRWFGSAYSARNSKHLGLLTFFRMWWSLYLTAKWQGLIVSFYAAFGAPRPMFDPLRVWKSWISRPFHRAKVHQHGLNLFVRQDEHGVQQILGSEVQRKHTVVFFTYVSHGLSCMWYIYDLLGTGVQRVMAMATSSGEEVLSLLNTSKTILFALSFHLESQEYEHLKSILR